MSSIIAFEPYVVRTGRGDPFVQAGIYRGFTTRGLSFGPDFVKVKGVFSRSVNFTQ
jgi:hypothetical protein